MSPHNPIIGIDFGTNKSVVTVMQAGKVLIIPDIQGHLSMPSLVMVSPDDHLYIGWDAINHPDRYKSRHFTISSIKREMGKAGETSWGNFKTYPQEISALIFGRLKMQAEAYLDCKIDQAVVAVPANFDVNQRWATIQAAEIAGLKVLRMLNEATAAVLSVSHFKQENECVLVFDFGAGTLDVSIMDCGENVYQVNASAGDDRLGGDDFDQLIIDHLLEKARKDYGVTTDLTPSERFVLKEAAVRAKIELRGCEFIGAIARKRINSRNNSAETGANYRISLSQTA